MIEPVVYFKPGCPFGIRLRASLTVHRVPHRSVRFRDDETGAAQVRDANDGNEISPTVYVAGQWLTNPGWREVQDATSSVQRPAATDHQKLSLRTRRTPIPNHQHVRRLSMKIRTNSIALIALAALLLAGCGSNSRGSPDEASASPTTKTESALEGTWRTQPISLSDAEATLRKHGLGKWIKKFRADPPIQGETVLILDVRDEWDLYGESEGGPREEIDYDADYVVKGDTVKVTHSTGSTTHKWSVDGERLTLKWHSTTQPAYNGVPDEVYQRALYMTAEFTRQD